jgi:hypothetical protein
MCSSLGKKRMKTIALGGISLTYYLSVFALPTFWNRVYTGIASRLDLTPEQIPLIPMGLNLFAAIVGLPAVLYLFRKSESTRRSPARLVFSGVCAVVVVLLVVGTVRWAASDPGQFASGLRATFSDSEGSDDPLAAIQDGVYRDLELGIQVDLPSDWEILSSNAIRRAHAAGGQAISSSGSAAIPNQLPEGIDQFLAIKKFPETHTGYNPSLAFVSYEKSAMQRSGLTDLDGLISPLAQSGPPYTHLSGPRSSRVGAFDGLEIRLRGDFPGATVRQHVYGFETANHYVTITAAFQKADDYQMMANVLRSVGRTNYAQQAGGGQPATRSESK